MKPTVINNGNNSENTNSNVPQTTSNNVQSDTNNNTSRINNDPRGFPSTFSAREFGFDDSDDDIFSDMGLRSRMNRMGHPFDWGARKRRGSTGHTDPQPNAYDQYFPDEPDFAGFGTPHWDTFNAGRKRNQHPTADRTGFFDYLPPEFRQYMPDDFGFSKMRQHPQMAAQSPPSTSFQKPPHPQHPHQQFHPQQPQQQYHPQQKQYHPQEFQQQQAPPTPKPNLCDAAIQTEDIDTSQPQTQTNNLNQHGLRNTVDMGQKSQHEEIRNDRAHSAPPREDLLAQQKIINPRSDGAANIAQDTYGAATNSGFSNTGTSMTPQCNIQQPQFNAAMYQKQQQERQQQQQQQQKHQQQQQQPQQQQRQSQPHYNTQPQTGARTVPIFVEGRSVPLVNKINIPQMTSEQVQQNQQGRQTQPEQTVKTQNRPAPFTTKESVPQETNAQAQIPPQTPHTTDCINKIQDIQRDVLDLMGKVERFGGLKGDKDYMYLDEMLTRNLLKLDTIDTNGKESIRLARKEAIKCIQASIGVLDAKSEINAKAGKLEEQQNESDTECANANQEIQDKTRIDVAATLSEDKDETITPAVEVAAPKHVSELQINLGDEEHSNDPACETGKVEVELQQNKENVGDGDLSKEQDDVRT